MHTSPSPSTHTGAPGRTATAVRTRRDGPVAATPYAFFRPHVVRSVRLSPTLRRIVLGGAELAAVVSGGRDQRFKLLLPHPGQDAPVLPDVLDADWYARWRAMDPTVRAVMRTYTIRAVRRRPPEIDVDVALHGDLGPASRWAARVRPGDRVTVLAPVVADNGGVDFRLPPDAGHVLLAGDASALPAIAGILESLPPGLPARVWIEVARLDDRLPLPTRADAAIAWLVGRDLLAGAVRAADLPSPDADTPYAWIAGEAAAVRTLRRHLVAERGWPRRSVEFAGYWRRGGTEDDAVHDARNDTTDDPADDAHGRSRDAAVTEPLAEAASPA